MIELVKLNLACGETPFGFGWVNIDSSRDLTHISTQKILIADIKNRIPFQSRTVDIIYVSHFLEHLDPFEECRRFLDECARVLKPSGLLRISVPDFHQIATLYLDDPKAFYAEYGYRKPWFNRVKTWNRRLGISVMFGHKMLYDVVSLSEVLEDSGFSEITPVSPLKQGLFPEEISNEIITTHVSHSLIVDCKNGKIDYNT